MIQKTENSIDLAKYHAIALNIAKRATRCAANADDLAQTAIIKLWQESSAGRIQDAAAIPGWLRVTIRRLTINAARKADRQRAISLNARSGDDLTIGESIADYREESSAEREKHEKLVMLFSAIGRLPTAQRIAAREFYAHGKSIIDIAAMVGAPEGTIKRRLHSARKMLRELCC